MAKPIDYQILEDVELALQQITKTNGYEREVGDRVSLKPRDLYEAPYDWIAIYGWDMDKGTNLAQAQVAPTLTIILECGVGEPSGEIQLAISQMAADVEKAVLVDPARNQLASGTQVVRVFDKYVIDEGETEGGCFVELAVQFRHKWGDPYLVV